MEVVGQFIERFAPLNCGFKDDGRQTDPDHLFIDFFVFGEIELAGAVES